jgi:hypothetical protein
LDDCELPATVMPSLDSVLMMMSSGFVLELLLVVVLLLELELESEEDSA